MTVLEPDDLAATIRQTAATVRNDTHFYTLEGVSRHDADLIIASVAACGVTVNMDPKGNVMIARNVDRRIPEVAQALRELVVPYRT